MFIRPYGYVYCFSAKLSRYSTGFDEAFRLMMIHLTRFDEPISSF